jgi:putative phage-type endonuclease
MKIYEDLVQGTESWGEVRKGVATASNADRIITPAKGELSKSAHDYACEILAAQMLPATWWYATDDYQSEAMAHGTNTEAEARAYFELETGKSVRQVGFIATDCGRAGCSPDGLVGEDELLELKCPQLKAQIKYLLDGKLPDAYNPQVHWQLVVTGFKACHFLSYAQGLPPLLLRVEPDEYTEKVRAAMQKFFELLAELRAKLDKVSPLKVPTLDQGSNPF